MSEDVTATLAAIRGRSAKALPGFSSNVATYVDSANDVPPLLAAVEAVLGLHVMQEKPVRSYEHCPAHAFNPETRRFGSFEDVRACPDCSYTEYYVCSHCDCPNDRWPCPTYEAIRAALTGKEAGDA